MEDFGFRLNKCLAFRNKRPIDLATECSIPKGNVSMFLSGRRPMPKLKTVQKIANYLNVSTTYLMGLTDEMFVPVVKPANTLSGVDVEKQALLNEIMSLCSFEDKEQLKTILTVVKAMTDKHA